MSDVTNVEFSDSKSNGAEIEQPEPYTPPVKTEQDVRETLSEKGRKAPTESSKPVIRRDEVEADKDPQSYVWLVNGEVLLCNDEDLPGHAGIGAEYGHWEKEDGSVFRIVAVYPAA